MQSSVVVALRTMVMITCLVAVPLVAMLGTALPKVVKSAFDGPERPSLSTPAVRDPLPPVVTPSPANQDAPVAAGAAPAEAGEDMAPARLPAAHITGVREVAEAPAAEQAGEKLGAAEIEAAPLWNPPPRTACSPRRGDMTVHFAPSFATRRRSEMRTESLPKTAYSAPNDEEPVDDAPDVEEDESAGVLAPVERSSSENPFVASERRLRQLGATYYRLETWGGEGQYYRCSARVGLGPRSRAARHFEAIDAAPSQAVDAVVQQISDWRASQASR